MYPHQIKAIATKYAFEANINHQPSRLEKHLQTKSNTNLNNKKWYLKQNEIGDNNRNI